MNTTREALYKALNDLLENQFKDFKWRLKNIDHNGKPNIPTASLEKANQQEVVDLLIHYYEENAPEVCICVLQKGNVNDVAKKLDETLQIVAGVDAHQPPSDYRSHVKKKFQTIEDPNSVPGEYVTLNQRYSKLIILDYCPSEEEREHEIRSLGRKHVEIIGERAESSTSVEALFNPNKHGLIPQVVVLQGAAGIGKTTMAKKIMLDWASQQLYYDKFNYVFYIYCREMNLHAESEKTSIAEIISKQWPKYQAAKNVIQSILTNEEKLLFIIDGFDELRYSLDNPEDSFCFDPWKKEPVRIILRSLFQKKLLPESSLIITTRPTTLKTLRRCLEQPHFFQILGFSRMEREEYFYNFFENKDQAIQAFRFVKQNDTLFTMCVIPLVSWIICTVMKQEMERGKDLQKTPYTLTAIYMLYLSSLLNFHHKESKQDVPRKLRSLCSLAAEGIWKKKILFTEEEVKKHILDRDDFFPLFLNENIFKRDIHCIQTFSFIHLSFQEFFAALFYVLEGEEEQRSQNLNRNLPTLLESHNLYFQSDFAVGFRFLFGFLNEENRMRELKKEFGFEISCQNKELLLDWVKNNMDRKMYSVEIESIANIDEDWFKEYYSDIYIHDIYHERLYFYLEQEILSYLYETQDENFLKNALCAITEINYHCNSDMELMILTYCLQHCQNLEDLCIRSFTPLYAVHKSIFLPEDVQWSLDEEYMENFFKALTNLGNVRVLRLEELFITKSCSRHLAEVLRRNQRIKELQLWLNNSDDQAFKVLCEGLQHPDCKIERLWLIGNITSKFCSWHLAEVFRKTQSLRELRLWLFNPDDRVVKMLCEGLQHPDCKVEKLGIHEGFVTESCVEHFLEVLKKSQRVRELQLFSNGIIDINLLEGLQHPDCKIKKLRLEGIFQENEFFRSFTEIFRKNQRLRELDMFPIFIEDEVVEIICEELKHSDFKVKEIRLGGEFLTKSFSRHLSDLLGKNQRLVELELFPSEREDRETQMLREGLKYQNYKLQVLRINDQYMKEFMGISISSFIRTLKGFFRGNKDYKKKLLCEEPKHSGHKSKELCLNGENITEKNERMDMDQTCLLV